MTSILVDARWDGNFGIGRFSREIRERFRASSMDAREFRSDRSALSPRGILALWRELNKSGVDIFYSPAFTGTFQTQVPQLLTVFDLIHMDVQSENSATKNLYYSRILKPAIIRSQWVATCSSHSARRIQEWLGPAAQRVRIENVGCGISDDFLSPSTSVETREKTLALVSNTMPHKNIETLLCAVARLPELHLNWVVNDTKKAADLIKNNAPYASISLLRGLSDRDLASVYSSSTALAMPSLIEGFGLPAIESMSCGTPVIYSAECAPVKDQCEPIPGNLAVDDGRSVDQWVEAIEHAVSQPRRVTLSSAERLRFSWDTVASNVSDAITRYADSAR